MSGNDGRIAVVTGGNRGIGFEVCRGLALGGARVILAARDDARGEAAAEKLRAQGLAVNFQPLDVADARSVARFAQWAAGGAGRVDILVNNAGVALDGFDSEVVRNTMAVNLFGAMQTTDRLLPLMGKGGRIVMVSSGLGELGCLGPRQRPSFAASDLTRAALTGLVEQFADDVAGGRHAANGWPSNAYRVSKAGLNAFTRIVAAQLRAGEILVNAVCPGWVRTGMGGRSAERGPQKGAETILWAATLPPGGPSGKFFRDRREISW
ncbi:MAG: SDR family oxidoreductase [bacterium]